jgi:CubicO group peptidase (beta-lactamase class C family)
MAAPSRLGAGAVAAALMSLLLGATRPAAAPSIDPELATRIDAVFADVDKPGVPGCALGIVRGDALVYARGYGLASVELGVPITPRTVFDIGSVSKQFTTLALMLLVEDGRV